MRKVLLMGQANVGKSVVFNRLAGAHVTESNYSGTTVDFAKGRMRLDHEDVEIIDVPGTFSLEPKDRAEEVAANMLKEEKDALVVCVIDSSKMERGLYLALEILERGHPMVIALNMWDVANGGNIKINAQKLEQILGIPVVPTVATRGEGLKELVLKLKKAVPGEVGKIVEKVGGKSGTHS
jgi:small GTP-binding protein domain